MEVQVQSVQDILVFEDGWLFLGQSEEWGELGGRGAQVMVRFVIYHVLISFVNVKLIKIYNLVLISQVLWLS